MLLEAERLSGGHAEVIGTRSLDLLLVATALVLGREPLVTFAVRPGAPAKAKGAGLEVLPPGPNRTKIWGSSLFSMGNRSLTQGLAR